MSSTIKTPSAKPLAPFSQRQITDALHTILRSHMQTTHGRRSSGFTPTQTQRNAELSQALQRSQRNL